MIYFYYVIIFLCTIIIESGAYYIPIDIFITKGVCIMSLLSKIFGKEKKDQSDISELQKIKDKFGDDNIDEIINYWAILYNTKIQADKMGSLYSQFRNGIIQNIREGLGMDFLCKLNYIENNINEKKLAKELDIVNGFNEGKYQMNINNHVSIDISSDQ